MDYFQGVVTEFLRANRSTFVNTECLIQLDEGDTPAKRRHWYCDAVAVEFERSIVSLCEVTYSTTMQPLIARLRAWDSHWPLICKAIARDCHVPDSWSIRPWLFVPEKLYEHVLKSKLTAFLCEAPRADRMPYPEVTYLEHVAPWNYRHWDRKTVALKQEADALLPDP